MVKPWPISTEKLVRNLATHLSDFASLLGTTSKELLEAIAAVAPRKVGSPSDAALETKAPKTSRAASKPASKPAGKSSKPKPRAVMLNGEPAPAAAVAAIAARMKQKRPFTLEDLIGLEGVRVTLIPQNRKKLCRNMMGKAKIAGTIVYQGERKWAAAPKPAAAATEAA